jgi:hypothetical protein
LGQRRGEHEAYVRLLGNDSYEADNWFYFRFRIEARRRVLVLSNSESSPLSALFQSVPDSTLQSKIDRSTNTLRYSLANYNTVFFEGMPPTENIARQLARFISQGQGTLVFIPSLEMNNLAWNKSALGQFVRFAGSFGKAGESIRSILISAKDIHSDALPNFYMFSKKIQKPISYHFIHKIFMPNASVLIGKKNRIFLAQDKENQIFSFGVPLQREATNFIYDPRFVPLIYGLVFADAKRAEFTDSTNTLRLKTQQAPDKIYLEAEQSVGASLSRRDRFSAEYRLPPYIQNGNYQIKNTRAAISINDLSIDEGDLLYSNIISEEKAIGAGQFQHWRLALLLAFLFYALELWLGRGRI